MAKDWFKKRLQDPYLLKSRQEGYRSRAAYKLQEIDQKYKLFKAGQKILDLGAAPGSWSEYVTKKLSNKVTLIAVDLLKIEPIPNVTIIQGDFRDSGIQEQIISSANGKLDIILSDMAPDTTGRHDVDTYNSSVLVNLALDLAEKLLKPGGKLVAKVFEGSEYQAILKRAKGMFGFAKSVSPKASLSQSREVFLVADNFR